MYIQAPFEKCIYLQDLDHSEVGIDNLKFKGHVDEDVFAGKSHSVL